MIILAADHGGYELKEYLKQYFTKHKIEYIDTGALEYDANDSYPEIAQNAVKQILKNDNSRGIFICGSGVGISMVTNRHKGIRAVLAYTPQIAEMARRHNNANVLALGGRYITKAMALKITKTFLNAEFEGGRHQARIDKF